MNILSAADCLVNKVRQYKSGRKDYIPGGKFNGERIFSYPLIQPETIVKKNEKGGKYRDKRQHPFIHAENVFFNIVDYGFHRLEK
ncbi:MAG: hypothetical protein ACT4OJ_02060 [Bacteroidota bacterium]